MERMSDTSTHTTESTERKPPTIAEIVREKTDNGRLIIEFFTDVMRGNIEGAQLCHRMDAAKELVKFGSEEAVRFIAKYKGIPCGHSLRGRRNSADPCIAEERTLVEVTLNAPAALTREFLTVLSGIDELLMRRLIRAQTADGGTIIDFLDDVMQDRNEGFKTHHRIAAAKELIVHIIRDEQPTPTPSPSTTPSPLTGKGREPALSLSKGEGDSPTPSPSTGEGRARPESPRRSEGDSPTPSPLTGEGWGEGDSPVVPAQAEGNPDNTSVVPAKAGTQGGGGVRSTPANPARTEPVEGSLPSVRPEPVEGPRPEFTEGPADSSSVVPAKEPAEGSALPSLPQLTTNNQQLTTLEQHWHEPDPWAGPIDSTTPARSPPL